MVRIRFATLALLTLSSLLPASPVTAATADHQQCFKIKDSAAATAYTADLVPTDGAFPIATGCEVKARAKLLCIDVEKTNVSPVPPGADEGLPAQKSLCYKVKCPSPPSPITPTETDQFGVHALEVKKSFLLCAPIPAALPPGSCTTAGDCSPLTNATVACVANVCTIGSCNAGFDDCDMMVGNGCETNTQSDAGNCGFCGTTCSFANATAACTMGACTLDTCDTDFADCDFMAGNGCETYTASDLSNCGGCGLQCSFANATAVCAASACSINSCNPGYADCDSMSGNGCEVDTQTDPTNCGSCGLVCPVEAPNCIASVCL